MAPTVQSLAFKYVKLKLEPELVISKLDKLMLQSF